MPNAGMLPIGMAIEADENDTQDYEVYFESGVFVNGALVSYAATISLDWDLPY